MAMMRWRAVPAPLMIALALSACAVRGGPALDQSVIPDAPDQWAARPELPVLANVDTSNSEVADYLRTGWLAEFGDEELTSAVREAFADNRNLQSVLADLRAARAQMRVARADLLPQVDLSGSATDSEGAATIFDGALEASWEADIWGRNLARSRAGSADARAAAADYAAARQALAATVARAWYDLGAARLSVGLAESDLERRQDTVRITDARFRAGLASGLDIRVAQTALSNSQDRLQTAIRAARNAARALEVLRGRYPDGTASGANDLVSLKPLPSLQAPVSVLARRPDLIAAEMRVDAAGLRATDARHAMFPRLTLRFDATTRSTSFGDLFDPGTYVDAISANLLQPLFRGGELLAEAERQGEVARATLFDYADLTLTAFQQVEDRLDAEQTLAMQVDATARAAEAARAAVGLTRSRYINGRSTIFDLINAQTSAIAAETRAVEARRASIENRINLHLALGDEPFAAD